MDFNEIWYGSCGKLSNTFHFICIIPLTISYKSYIELYIISGKLLVAQQTCSWCKIYIVL